MKQGYLIDFFTIRYLNSLHILKLNWILEYEFHQDKTSNKKINQNLNKKRKSVFFYIFNTILFFSYECQLIV